MRQSVPFIWQVIALVGVTAIVAPAVGKQRPLSVSDAVVPSKFIPPPDPSFPQPGVMEPNTRPEVDDMIERLRGDPDCCHSLADILTRARKAAVWWEYARDVAGVSARLQSSSEGTTILVPLNDAMQRLSRKPHQNPDGSEDDSNVKNNVDRFISAHVIPELVKLPTKGEVTTLLPGKKVQIEKLEHGGWIVKPGDISVDSFAEVNNGMIVFMNGVIDVD